MTLGNGASIGTGRSSMREVEEHGICSGVPLGSNTRDGRRKAWSAQLVLVAVAAQPALVAPQRDGVGIEHARGEERVLYPQRVLNARDARGRSAVSAVQWHWIECAKGEEKARRICGASAHTRDERRVVLVPQRNGTGIQHAKMRRDGRREGAVSAARWCRDRTRDEKGSVSATRWRWDQTRKMRRDEKSRLSDEMLYLQCDGAEIKHDE
ncbi:hypothetical protein DFH06DRAFT_1294307 [Mycena polygramma]|nr:hypothetical protein DFH06DRAFT_1294307 [Mycena polygramma]